MKETHLSGIMSEQGAVAKVSALAPGTNEVYLGILCAVWHFSLENSIPNHHCGSNNTIRFIRAEKDG